MDPTSAIPVHFTLQAFAIAATGLLLAWSLVRGHWLGAIGAATLALAEGLHAGSYIATDDEPALVTMRLVGIALFSVAALRVSEARRLYAAGALAVAGAAVWSAAVGGGLADPTPGPHALIAIGSLLLAAWGWFASRDSMRLRVLNSLVAMLAIAVVVGGGAVSRVAALDKRNEQSRQLGSAAQATGAALTDTADGLSRRAGLLSPLVASDLVAVGPPAELRADLRSEEPEAIVVVDRTLRLRAFVIVGGDRYGAVEIISGPAVRSALAGRSADAFDVSDGKLLITSAAPVFRAGASQRPQDVIGVVAIAQSRTPSMLRDSARAYAPDAEVVIVGRASAATDPSLSGVKPGDRLGDGISFERLDAGDDTRPAATTRLGDQNVKLVVVGSDQETVDAATGLLRALLVAILAAALLAIVIALWLSARVTRPILDLAAGAEQVKADFLASVSHELRTPLTPIRGYTELLRRGRVPARRAADYLDEIGEAAGRLERIVTLLLDVAAQEAGRFRIEAGSPPPGGVLEDAAERWKHRVRKHPVRVVAARSLPRIHGDPEALARALDELIDNAMKFSPDGGAVELRARRTKTGVELSVNDHGIGMSADEAVELTRAFAQADPGDRRRFGGLGLGLAFVSGVLRAHGSSLTVRSAPGEGSTFSFTLPTASMVSRMPAKSGRRVARQPEAG